MASSRCNQISLNRPWRRICHFGGCLTMIKRISTLFLIVALLLISLPVLYAFTTSGIEISSFRMIFNQIVSGGISSPQHQLLEQQLQLPEGFSWVQYATNIPGARMLVLTDKGDLLVSLPRKGQVWRLLKDADSDGQADGQELLLDGLDRPHGLALSGRWLYVAERGAVSRIAFNVVSGEVSGQLQRLIEGLPRGGNHWSKSIGFGPDQMLYLSIGSTCNVCIEKDKRRASMMRFQPDGSDGAIIASGLRNSVGFDWAPWNDALYATDNGRDMLGDDYPPCELNRIEAGQFYGWPFVNGFGDPDPDFGEGNETPLNTAVSPEHGFRAHNAPLGIRFNRSTALPASYRNSAFVALHGSWNRSTPDGYKVVSLHWDDQGKISERDFMTGFEKKGKIIGRPVDIVQGPGGELYLSDDYSGTVYRIDYTGLE